MSSTAIETPAPAKLPKLALNPKPAILLGFSAIALIFGGFGGWAAIAPIASAVIAPGVVTVDTNRKKIQHLEGGVVEELLVRDGDSIAAGDVLIRLDETQPRASLAILQGEYDATRAIEARLLAERSGAQTIELPSDLLDRAAETNVAEILSGQESFFEARRKSFDGEVSILRSRIARLQDNIAGLQAQQKSKERQIVLIKEETKGLRRLLAKGYTDRSRLLGLEREEADLEGERGEHRSDIAHARTSMAETELNIIQLRSDFQEEVVDELRTVRASLSDLRERIGAAKHILKHIEIRAPVNGVVVDMQVHTKGGVIRPGETILEIVPDDDNLIVEAQVDPLDIDNLAVGQQSDVHLTAFKRWTTPAISGEVTYVSADRLEDQSTGRPYYVARVAVADDEVAKLEDRNLYPGMPAEVMIKTGERTALQYLAQPMLDSMNRAWREE